MTDKSTSQIPQTKPVSKPTQVSTVLPDVEEESSTIKTEDATTLIPESVTGSTEKSLEINGWIETIANTLLPSIKDSVDGLFGPQDDDSDDAIFSTDSDEEPSLSTVATTLTDGSEVMETIEEDKDEVQISSEQAPDVAAQIGDSMKPADILTTTELDAIDVSTSTGIKKVWTGSLSLSLSHSIRASWEAEDVMEHQSG